MTTATGGRVAVLGAGPAGLAGAWRAAEAGHRVVVLERAAVVGGMAGSFVVGGQRVDHGSHRLHPSVDPLILAELRRLLGPSLQWRTRHGRIRLADRWIHFPLRPADLVRRLPPAFAVAGIRDAVLSPLRRPRQDTFAEVVRAGLGPTMLDRFYGPYARKLWGLDPEELSGEQARRRIAAGTTGALVRKVLRRSPTGSPDGFWYPAGGFGAIVEAIADAAVGAGAELRTGTEVTTVGRGGDGAATIELADGERLTADHVWSTLPLTTLARVVRPAPPPPVLEAAGRLRFRALVLVYLVLDQPAWTEFDAHYIPGLDTPVSRVSEPKRYRDGPDDPPDRTVLCAEVPCSPGDALWAATADDLAALVGDGLAAQQLPRPRPVEVAVRRLPVAYPVYARGFEPAFAALDGWASSLEGVVTLGRHGLYAHDNTHHALAMGWAAAEALEPDGTWDAASWAAARARFATHVVED